MNTIQTSNVDVANELRENGYTELKKQGDMFVFLNNKGTDFSIKNKKDVVFTNSYMI